MTAEQRCILQVGGCIGFGAVLFPPFQRLTYNGGYVTAGFHFIGGGGDLEQVNVALLSLLLIVVSALTGVFYATSGAAKR